MRALLVVLGILLLSSATADARPKKQAKQPRVVAVAKPAPKKLEPKGQSIGAPWAGSLRRATKFKSPERTFLRRPHRAFATRTTIEHTRRAIIDTLEQFPKAHALAISGGADLYLLKPIEDRVLLDGITYAMLQHEH